MGAFSLIVVINLLNRFWIKCCSAFRMPVQTRQATLLEIISKRYSCSICLFSLVDPYRVDPCEHTFCNECLSKWLKRSVYCPVCRTPMDKFFADVKSSNGLALNLAKLSKEFKRSCGAERDVDCSECLLVDEISVEQLVKESKIRVEYYDPTAVWIWL